MSGSGDWAAQSEPDAVEYHPARYGWKSRFEDVRVIEKKEGGATYAATGEGAYWVVSDEGTLADFLLEDEHDGLIRLTRYDDRDKWERAVAAIVERARRRLEDSDWPSPWTYEEMQQWWQEGFEERTAGKRRDTGS